MRKLLLLLLLIPLLQSCEEEVKPKLNESEPRLVIEGIFTDVDQPHYIYVSETQGYFSESDRVAVSGAQVTISDDAGGTEILEEIEKGVFVSDDLQGVTGNIYTLTVQYNGNTYESSSEMQVPPIFDSLTYRFVEESPLKDEGYYIYFYGKTPKPEINYYRWLVYKNDTLHGTDPEDFLLASDEFVTEQLSDLEFPFAFQVDDTVRLEMYGLDYSMYLYYNELLNILFNDGGLFSPPPTNPTSNIENLTNPLLKPLGYFQVSAFADQQVIITEK